MIKIAIVGHGFVGKAVEYGFTNDRVKITLIDPLLGTSIDDLKNDDYAAAFVCVPTPMGADGSIDSSIVEKVVAELSSVSTNLIVLKSTVLPNIVDELSKEYDNFIYNPEFLTERNYKNDFVNPPMHVFGGNKSDCHELKQIYDQYSNCNACPVQIMTAKEASFVKYTINTFLATKVAWFNELYDLMDSHGANYETVMAAVSNDKRVGTSHTKVPGPDGKRWYGLGCFPKDCAALIRLSGPESMKILRTSFEVNSKGRSQYELDDREIAQKISYNIRL